MNVQEQTIEGLKLLAAHGVEPERYRQVSRVLHPKVTDEAGQDMIAAMSANTWQQTEEPLTLDNVARQLADRHGAFRWAGPVGNGMTLSYYQSRFREMAEEHMFAWQQLGLLVDVDEGTD